MSRPLARTLAPYWTALRIMLLLTIVLGIAYPLLITGVGQVVTPAQSNGSLIRNADGQVAGSSLLGQRFDAADGEPLPQYFQPRPSIAGDGYDPTASGGSNQGPESLALAMQIAERREVVAAFNGVPAGDVPVDAITASGSGLDPHISVEYARIQVERVAEARGLTPDVVAAAVDRATAGRDAGMLGEPRVSVVELNLALDELAPEAQE